MQRRWLIACAALALVQISKRADWESGARDGFLPSVLSKCDVMKPRWACAAALLCGYIRCVYTVCVRFVLFVFPYVGIWFPGNFPLPEAEEWHWPESDGVGETQRPLRHTACNPLLHTCTHWRRSHLGTASINYARFNLCHSGTGESFKQCRDFKCRNTSWILTSC